MNTNSIAIIRSQLEAAERAYSDARTGTERVLHLGSQIGLQTALRRIIELENEYLNGTIANMEKQYPDEIGEV